jgi:adenosyl cobinamide kinase/adenosyl cobinamide phosphate guanylyltransferase
MNKKVEDGTNYIENYEKEKHKGLEYIVSKNEFIVEETNQIRKHLENQKNNFETIDNELAEIFGEQIRHKDMIMMNDELVKVL